MKINLHSRALWSQLITAYRIALGFVSTEENLGQAQRTQSQQELMKTYFSFQLSHMTQRAQGEAL